MKDHVYKQIELTGTSTTSVEDAVEQAIQRAHKTIKNLCWFQVLETRGFRCTYVPGAVGAAAAASGDGAADAAAGTVAGSKSLPSIARLTIWSGSRRSGFGPAVPAGSQTQ